MRTVKGTMRRKNSEAIDDMSRAVRQFPQRRGWIERFRSALGMSITDLASKAGLDRSVISRSEQREKDGNITILQIEKLAEAMGGRLVYAIVPIEGSVEDLVLEQARKNAGRIIKRARAHMALEAQSEGLQNQEAAIEDLASEMAREMARGFWR